MKKATINQGENQFEHLLKLYLKQRNFGKSQIFTEHLDEDSLTAFVEGRLNNFNDPLIVSHLIGCPPCRRTTLELLRLSESLDENFDTNSVASVEPNLFQEFWSELMAKVFSSGDNTVFAHEDRLESNNNSEESTDKTQ